MQDTLVDSVQLECAKALHRLLLALVCYLLTLWSGLFLRTLSAPSTLFSDCDIGRIVLVNVADVVNGFPADLTGSHDFDVVEPYVGTQPQLIRPASQAGHACGPRIVS